MPNTSQQTLTQVQRETIQGYLQNNQYAEGYLYLRSIAEDARQTYEPDSPEAYDLGRLSTWLDRASSINRDDGSFTSEFVRGATESIGAQLGRPITEQRFQEVSDSLARDVLQGALDTNRLPSATEVVNRDVDSAVRDLDLPQWAWAGTIGDVLPPWLWGLGHDYVQLPLPGSTAESWREAGEAWGQALCANFDGVARGVGIDVSCSTGFRSGLVAPVRPPGDPLAIDLDGDGLETVGIGANPVLFDHNADGIRTGTGWVRGDDAWLVLDRDANGTIDSGRELFGVDTLITNANGTQRMARDGFEALRTLDSNSDGVFNDNDAAFSQVRLWQDLNQDGISQGNELFTLADRSIASIGLTPTGGTTNLGNGNIVTGRATVTRGNGSTTEVDSVAVSTEASNLDLALNPFYREFTDVIPLTVVARGLPEMGGSGVVRDLREAMSLGTAQSDALVSAVQSFVAGETRAAQRGALDELLRTWAATEAISDRFTMETPGQETRRFVVTGSADAALRAQLNRVMPILEVFNGMTVDDSGWTATTSTVSGQLSTIRFESFSLAPYGAVQTPTRSATVDAVSDDKRGAIFPATLTLQQTHIDIDGKRIALSPGMNLTAEIKTGQRRVIDYLMSPVQRVVGESLGER